MVPRSTCPGGPGRRGPGRLARHLVAPLVVVAAGLAALPGSGTPAAASPGLPAVEPPAQARVAAAEEDQQPLELTLDEITPGQVPRTGSIRLSGRITNADDRPWSTINLYPFIGDAPMTTPAELLAAQGVGPLDYVGARVTDPAPYAVVDRLEPGQSADWSFTVARSRLPVSAPGAYWFGVHALGQDEDGGRDSVADGRARTFLPLVDRDPGGPGVGRDGVQPVALVVPLRRRLLHDAEGRVLDPAGWATSLSDVGRLGGLSRLGETAAGAPLTWLVDPALPDAVARLAAGNPARSLAPTIDPEDQPVEGGATTPTPAPPQDSETEQTEESATPGEDGTVLPVEPTPTPTPADEEQLAELDPDTRTAAVAATRWLERMRDALSSSQQVLALPYGDVDVAAAAEHDPEVYEQARNRAGSTLAPLEVGTEPASGSPGGFIDATGLAMLDTEDTVVVNDRMVGGRRLDAPVPAVAEIAGRRVVVASVGAAAGGPGPGPRRSTVAMRQRVLAEAAVRLVSAQRGLGEEQQPLVVTLPPSWSPDRPEDFVPALLEADWVSLETVAEATDGLSAPEVDVEALAYPERQVRSELPAEAFAAVEDLIGAGRLLEDVLTFNDQVASVVSGEAYSTVSYYARQTRLAHDRAADLAEAHLRSQLAEVRVTTPPGVTLSSVSGRLPASVENGLDVAVTVRLDARSDPPMELVVPDSIDIPAGGRVGVLLDATAQTEGVHNVTLAVTDLAGEPLGGQAALPIRAAQVSDVIWLIIGSGAVLLFGAIAVRVVRRVRTARATEPA